MKKTIRLNENEFRNIIIENVKRILNEENNNISLSNKLRQIADWLEKDSTGDYSSINDAVRGYDEENYRDPHFTDSEQIAKDKKNDWSKYEEERGYKDPWYSEKSNFLPDYNKNAEGEAFYNDMMHLPYNSSLNAMSAMSDEPNEKWYGQTARSTTSDRVNAGNSWFPADIDNTELPDGTHRINNKGEIDGLDESIRRVIRKYLR